MIRDAGSSHLPRQGHGSLPHRALPDNESIKVGVLETGFISKPWESKDMNMSTCSPGWGDRARMNLFCVAGGLRAQELMGLAQRKGWGGIWEAKSSGNRPAAEGLSSQLTARAVMLCTVMLLAISAASCGCMQELPWQTGTSEMSHSGPGWAVRDRGDQPQFRSGVTR